MTPTPFGVRTCLTGSICDNFVFGFVKGDISIAYYQHWSHGILGVKSSPARRWQELTS